MRIRNTNVIVKMIIMSMIIVCLGLFCSVIKLCKNPDIAFGYDENDVQIGFDNAIAQELDIQQFSGEKDDEEFDLNVIESNRVKHINLIENAKYFEMNPSHKNGGIVEAKYGACGMIALQLLFGYHNYYSDRRLIPVSSGTRTFLAEGYGEPETHPHFLKQPSEKPGNIQIGTTVALYDEIWDLAVLPEDVLGQSMMAVVAAGNKFINKHASSIKNTVTLDYKETALTNSKKIIMDELNANRPVLIGFNPVGTGAVTYHMTVAYGSAELDGKFGYVVHYGLGRFYERMWVPADWIGFVTTMKINHTHTYKKDYRYEEGNEKWYKCTQCGHTSIDELALITQNVFNSDGVRIIGTKFPLQEHVVLPSTIGGKPLVEIGKEVASEGEGAFENQDQIVTMTFPNSVRYIRPYAFNNCTQLTECFFDANSNLYSIGSYAFKNSNLMKFDLPDNVAAIYEGAFEGCEWLLSFNINEETSKLAMALNSVFKDCYRLKSISLPKYLNSVGDYMFSGCATLSNVSLNNAQSIGQFAFADCSQLDRVTAGAGIRIGKNSFVNCERFMDFSALGGTVIVDAQAFVDCPNVTLFLSSTCKLDRLGNPTVPVVKNCTFDAAGEYIISFVKSSANPSNLRKDNKEIKPQRSGYSFDGWFDNAGFTGTSYADVTTAPNGALYAKWRVLDSCVAEGTLITLADGRRVAVENLKGDEMLLVWNMFTGSFDVAPILFIDSDPLAVYEVIYLRFSDGTVVKVISEHAFFDFDLNKYVYLDAHASKYIGHEFNRQTVDESGSMSWKRVRLTDVTVKSETTRAFSPVTYGHLCYYVNGMLSMPGGIEGLFNIFEVDGRTMTFDAQGIAEDIEKYGVFSYEEFARIVPVPRYVFEAVNGAYLKVAIGKGLVDADTLIKYFERYGGFFEENQSA